MKSNLTIYFFSSTHWDREWYQTFQGFRYRLVNMMNEMIDVLEKDTSFSVFHLDGQTIVLEDFLEIEPAKKDRLVALIRERRVIIGPWYNMPDEFLVSGESLIRNLLVGQDICQEFQVPAWKYGYICDIFGHIAQMPQIFNGFNISHALLGRGTNEHNCPAHFRWQAPDGSECITFKVPDCSGYGAFCLEVIREFEENDLTTAEKKEKIQAYVESEIKRSDIPVVVIMDGMDHEAIHRETPEYLKWIQELYPQAEVKHTDLIEMSKELAPYYGQMLVKTGELYEPAKKKGAFNHVITHTLSSRYPLKKANDECQSMLEKWIEPLTAIAELRGLSIQKTYVDMAYKHLLQNHPHDSICGCSIDQVHKDMEYRFHQTQTISEQVLSEIIQFEKQRYPLDSQSHTRILLLWNPLPFLRKEVITVDIDFQQGYPCQFQEPFGYELKNSFKVFNRQGNEIPYGLVSMKKNYLVRSDDQTTERVDRHTVSLEVEMPPMGTTEYKIVPFDAASRYLKHLSQHEREVENEFVKLTVNDNGTVKVYDKLNYKTYDSLLGFLDDGEIGDGWYHANPVEDRLISNSGVECIIERVENGPSRTVFRITHWMRVPEEMEYYPHGIRRSDRNGILKISSLVGLSKGANYIDVETNVTNTVKDHRLRLTIPTGIDTDTYFVNQPFAFVERKSGIHLETQEWKECDVPEKQMGGIVGKRAADGAGIAFVSAYGLHECAAMNDDHNQLVITLFRGFRKTVFTNGEEGGQILGDIKFKYLLVLLSPAQPNTELIRLQDALQAGVRTSILRVSENYKVVEPCSYFELSDSNVCLSILKRPEDGNCNEMILRLYNPTNQFAKTTLKCFWEIAYVTEVNLNEEYVRPVSFDRNTFEVQMEAWKIQTYRICFV